MDHAELLKKALKPYGMNLGTLVVERQLQPDSWHGDLHYKIHIDGTSYSARFIGDKRYEHSVFVELTDEVLAEQIRFCKYLRDRGIPFMKHRSSADGEPYTFVEDNGKQWRFVLFEWIEGEHITHCTEPVTEKFSIMARHIHDISSHFVSDIFTKQSHLHGSGQFLQMILGERQASKLTLGTSGLLQKYIDQIEHHRSLAVTDTLEFIVQSDLNPLNIVWSASGEIIGIVDFESITYTDRVEGLAWLIKWYSRPHGIGSAEMSLSLAQAVLRGYGAAGLLSAEQFQRLPSSLWLSGCLNWNFTAKTLRLLKNNEDSLLREHITKYFKRGEMLLSLI